jgi:hypothetical protein
VYPVLAVRARKDEDERAGKLILQMFAVQFLLTRFLLSSSTYPIHGRIKHKNLTDAGLAFINSTAV